MADDPRRVRIDSKVRTFTEVRPQRPRPAATDSGTVPGTDACLAAPVGRRALLGLIAGGAAVAATGTYALLPRSAPKLPVPAGQAAGPEYLAATLAVKPAPAKPMPTDGRSWSSCAAPGAGAGFTELDLVLAVDTTGSMGSVLGDVKANLQALIGNLRALGSVRVGVVAYKDLCDREVVRPFPLTPLDEGGTAALSAFIATLTAGGGCDWPEKMDAALDVATSMAWRGGVPASIVIVADAPAHPQDEPAARATAQAFISMLPGAQVSLIDTGSGGHAFMQALPKSGGGQYVTYDGRILNSLFPAITGCDG